MIPLSFNRLNASLEKPIVFREGSLKQDLLLQTEAISHVGSWELNLFSRKLTWSDECYRICGFEPGSFEPELEKALNIFHPDDQERVREILAISVRDRKEYKIESRIVRPDGSIRFVISHGLISVNSDNEADRLFGILHDITEQKEIALALEENRQIYKSLFEQNPQAVYSFDLQGNFLSANDSLSNITDCSVEELLKISFIPFIDPEDLESVYNHFVEATKGEIQNYNARFISSKGKKGSVNITNFPIIVNQKIIGVYGIARDITLELKAQQDLQRSKEELENVMNSSNDVICTVDENGVFQKVGAACEKVWGYTPDELIGMHYIDLVVSEDVAHTNQIANEVMNGKEVTNFENRYIKKDQSFIHLIWSARWDSTDKIMYSIARDATERKEAESKLKKSDQKIVNVLESITDGFYILDKNWTVTYWNREAEKILLVNSSDIIGRNIWETFTDISELRIYNEYKNVMTSRISASFEEFLPHLELWVEMNVYPFEDGISVYFKRINERKVAEENILIAKERYDWVAKATNDAIWDWNIKTNGLIWGDGFETLFGYDVKHIIVTLDSWAEHIHPDDLKRVSEKILACIHGSQDLQWEDEYKYVKADGSYAYVYDRGFVIRDENGIATRMIGAMQDITERKHNEQILNDLHIEVQKRAEELALSNTELEQFAYVASHDLQEPLRMVTGFLNQLEKNYGAQLDDKAKKYIHFAVDGAVRMRQIILDLLEYSRVGRHGYDMQLIDLNELIAETVHLNKPLIEESNAIINWGDLPTIKGAKTPLQQVFQNLISNALKYINTVNTPTITINVVKKDKHWLISIADNGIGIEAEFFTKIFVLFKRLHSKEEYSGTGIGLAICKKIIENHGGKIWVESVRGEGSLFYFTIMR